MSVAPLTAGFHRVTYTGEPALHALTSGRLLPRDRKRIMPYVWYRLGYNVSGLAVRQGVAGYQTRTRSGTTLHQQSSDG